MKFETLMWDSYAYKPPKFSKSVKGVNTAGDYQKVEMLDILGPHSHPLWRVR